MIRPSKSRARTVALVAAGTAMVVTAGLLALGTAQAATGAKIVGKASGRCVDVTGGYTANGALVQLWDCNGGANQQVALTSSGQLTVLGRCLDAASWGRTAGTKVQLWDCNGGANQRWKHNASGTITGVDSGLCLDADRASTANGTLLQLWSCTGSGNQSWTTSAGGPPPPTATPAPAAPPSTGTTTSCSAAPVDPQATAAARRLLCYLYSQYGNHILSGQQQNGNGEDEFTYIQSKTGKLPAVRGEDIGDGQPGQKAANWWNAGGIPMIGYHMGAPNNSADGYTSSQTQANINAALTAGTTDNQRLRQRLDNAAAELKKVQDAGGATIWRPYHEAGGTWFWWSKEGGSQYVRLWKYTFDYMTKTKGLHNLVWLLGYDGSPQSSFYPGKAYVDVAGADNYASDHGAMAPMYNATRNIAGSSIPIALHENGALPDPDLLRSSGAKWVLFNTWARDYIDNTSLNPVSVVQKVYGSPYVVTRDEVPNLR